MQVVARARAAGMTCRPRDVFVEQTVARLARVVSDGPLPTANPTTVSAICSPRRSCAGCGRWNAPAATIDQFNQTMVVQAPDGVTEADVACCCRPCWTGTPCCDCASTPTTDGGWSLTVPDVASVDARACMHTVQVLSDDAVIAATSRLNPAAGVMLSALWVAPARTAGLVLHHFAVDAVSWWILLEDINMAWAAAARRRARRAARVPGRRCGVGRRYSPSTRSIRDVVQHADAWRRVASTPAALPAVQPEVDTYATAGHRSAELDADTTRLLLTEVPAAFHAGTQDILLIALAFALKEFLTESGRPHARIGIDIEGHGRQEELSADVDLSRTVGWFTIKYPVACRGRRPVLGAGDRGRCRARRGGRRTPRNSFARCPTASPMACCAT